MKFDVYFTIRGPGGRKEVPNTYNPVEAQNLEQILSELRGCLPNFSAFGAETVGLKIEPHDE